MLVLFVGDEPSKLNKNPEIAFVGAKCEKRLMEWISYLVGTSHGSYDIINRIYKRFYAAIANADIVIALGNKASDALKNVLHFKLPHPSGLNRQVNNKEFIKKQLKACQDYIKSHQI